jgi:hypothetical protein
MGASVATFDGECNTSYTNRQEGIDPLPPSEVLVLVNRP